MIVPIAHTRELERIVTAARSRSDAVDLLFRHYKALATAQDREGFILALAAEVITLRAICDVRVPTPDEEAARILRSSVSGMPQ